MAQLVQKVDSKSIQNSNTEVITLREKLMINDDFGELTNSLKSKLDKNINIELRTNAQASIDLCFVQLCFTLYHYARLKGLAFFVNFEIDDVSKKLLENSDLLKILNIK